MTNKEAARTLLYGLSRETSKETYLDAICMAICALMREEEVGKSKHEKVREYKFVWHDARNNPPKEDGTYRVLAESIESAFWCDYIGGKWVMSVGTFKGTVNDVIKWTDIHIYDP